MESWTLDSWRHKPIAQQPPYEDVEAVRAEAAKLAQLPSLVAPSEIEALRAQLRAAGEGKAFVLIAGDCAERFEDCTEAAIEAKLAFLHLLGRHLQSRVGLPVVRIARIAGQYAKPRSENFETINGEKFPSYRGDNVNRLEKEHRNPDPKLLVEGYFRAAATLNRIAQRRLNDIPQSALEELQSSRDFAGFSARQAPWKKAAAEEWVFAAHEALLLEFESALTRTIDTVTYDLSGHFLWIGERTRALDGAHIEFFRGLANPIGVKIGPTTTTEELTKYLKTLNPQNEDGKIVLITRLGLANVAANVPRFAKAVTEAGARVVWISDPMHGNTFKQGAYKTRRAADLLGEIIATRDALAANGQTLNGIHLEATPFPVTECLGGPVSETNLGSVYTTGCDPRLNFEQSWDLIANL